MENTLSERLKTFIKHTGLSDKEFALRLDVSKAEISRWQKGVKIPLATISRILKLFPDLNAHWFITGNGKMLINPDNMVEKRAIHYCSDPECRPINKLTYVENVKKCTDKTVSKCYVL